MVAGLSIGMGKKETDAILGYSDTPGLKTFASNAFSHIKREISSMIRSIGEMCVHFGLQEEF